MSLDFSFDPIFRDESYRILLSSVLIGKSCLPFKSNANINYLWSQLTSAKKKSKSLQLHRTDKKPKKLEIHSSILAGQLQYHRI